MDDTQAQLALHDGTSAHTGDLLPEGVDLTTFLESMAPIKEFRSGPPAAPAEPAARARPRRRPRSV